MLFELDGSGRKNLEIVSVVTVEAVVSAEPDKPPVVLDDFESQPFIRKSVFGGKMRELNFILLSV